MKTNFFIFLFIIISITKQQENEEIGKLENPATFTFNKTVYILGNSVKKVIPVYANRTNNVLDLYINGTLCEPKYNEKFAFYCPITEIGFYTFSYQYNSTNYTIPQEIFVVNKMTDIFNITPSRETKCLFDDEKISFTVEAINENLTINLSNIQVFAYAPPNKYNTKKVKNLTESILFESEVIDDNKAIFTLNSPHLNKQYIVRITENFDYDDTLGKIQSFTFTELGFDSYFYPNSQRIRIQSNLCEFKPDTLVFKNSENKEFEVNCNESSTFYYSNYYYCYFNETIEYNGKMDIYFHNQKIKSNIIASVPFDEISIIFSNEDFNKKSCNYCEVQRWKRIKIKSANDKFNVTSINKVYVEHGDDFETSKKIYERSVSFSSNGHLYFNWTEDVMYYEYRNIKGEINRIVKLERILFEDEKILTAKYLTYKCNFVTYSDALDEISFQNPYFVTGNIESSKYSTNTLKFKSYEAKIDYGYKFCGSNSHSFNPVQFNCYDQSNDDYYNRNYYSIKLISNEPGFITTQLRYKTGKATLKIINIQVENYCQKNIFGDERNIEDAIINIYYPIEENKYIRVNYNGVDLQKNEKVNLVKNPMDYNFESYVIPANQIIQGGIAYIYYGDEVMGQTKVTYSNTIIPTIVKIKEIINTKENYTTTIPIRFKDKMTIGINETTFYLQYYDINAKKYKNEKCTLENNGMILNCENHNDYNKKLYYSTTCESDIQLDYEVIFFTPPETSDSISKYYYVLPGHKQSVTFYYEYLSPI